MQARIGFQASGADCDEMRPAATASSNATVEFAYELWTDAAASGRPWPRLDGCAATSKHSSMAQRRPAAGARVASVVSAGPKTSAGSTANGPRGLLQAGQAQACPVIEPLAL